MTKEEYAAQASSLIQTLFAALVDDVASVRIEVVYGEQTVQFKVNVHPSNIGQALGKKGKNIEAVRRILYSFANKHRIRSILELEGMRPNAIYP